MKLSNLTNSMNNFDSNENETGKNGIKTTY